MADAVVCATCGLPPTEDDPLERGHIVARIDGGTNDPENYAAIHRSCNRREGAEIANEGRATSYVPPI